MTEQFPSNEPVPNPERQPILAHLYTRAKELALQHGEPATPGMDPELNFGEGDFHFTLCIPNSYLRQQAPEINEFFELDPEVTTHIVYFPGNIISSGYHMAPSIMFQFRLPVTSPKEVDLLWISHKENGYEMDRDEEMMDLKNPEEAPPAGGLFSELFMRANTEYELFSDDEIEHLSRLIEVASQYVAQQ